MICGVDEAGRGPVLGPLVVAGVAVPSNATLRPLRVADSKRVSPSRRVALDVEVRKIAQVEVVVVSAEDIDAMREEMTLNELEARVFAAVIRTLRPGTAYVDSADASEAAFARAIRRGLGFPCRVVSRHRAEDRFPAVAAASIVAKVRRDEEVRRIEDELGTPVGSGYPSDPITVAFLQEWIRKKGSLPPHTRASWRTARRMLAEASNRTLEEFGGGDG